MSHWHQHQQKTSRPWTGATDGDASVSPIQFLLDLAPALFVSLPFRSLILWQPENSSCSSDPDFFTALSFGSCSLLNTSAHSAFQALSWQISVATLPEHHHPSDCYQGFCTLSGHFKLCSSLFKGLLPFPLPPHAHWWLQSPIPHPFYAKQAHAATQKWGELFIYLWGVLLTTALSPLTPPAALVEQHRQVPGRVLVLWIVQITQSPPCLAAEHGGDFPVLCSSEQPGGCQKWES